MSEILLIAALVFAAVVGGILALAFGEYLVNRGIPSLVDRGGNVKTWMQIQALRGYLAMRSISQKVKNGIAKVIPFKKSKTEVEVLTPEVVKA